MDLGRIFALAPYGYLPLCRNYGVVDFHSDATPLEQSLSLYTPWISVGPRIRSHHTRGNNRTPILARVLLDVGGSRRDVHWSTVKNSDFSRA
jgi:hypothetical protein